MNFSLSQLFSELNGQEPDLTPSFGKLDGGRYRVNVESVESRVSQDGRGMRVIYTTTIVEGQSVGRKMWINFPVVNESEIVMKTAHKDIMSFTKACGSALAVGTELHSNIGKLAVVELVYSRSKDGLKVYENYRFLDAKGELLQLNGVYTPPLEEPSSLPQAPQNTAPQNQVQTAPANAPWVQNK